MHRYKVVIQVIVANALQNLNFKNHPKDIIRDKKHPINPPSIKYVFYLQPENIFRWLDIEFF